MAMRLSVKEIAEFVLQLFMVRFHRPSQAGGVTDPSRSAFPIPESNAQATFQLCDLYKNQEASNPAFTDMKADSGIKSKETSAS
jgi:hypothetical protein